MSEQVEETPVPPVEPNAASVRWSTAFRRSLPLKLELDFVARILAELTFDAPSSLDVGFANPVSSRLMRRIEGDWSTLALTEEDRAASAELLEEAVALPAEDGTWPFEDKQFDVVVVAHSVLIRAADDLALIQECHRVLKTTGHLVIFTEHAKPFGFARILRIIMRARPNDLGWSRPGYSERELFELMKIGFDVLSMRSFSRLCVESIRVWQEGATQKGRRRQDQIGRTADWLYRLAFQLDLFLCLTRGHVLVVHGRRRQWRARQAPILNDGRNISEAVLHRALK